MGFVEAVGRDEVGQYNGSANGAEELLPHQTKHELRCSKTLSRRRQWTKWPQARCGPVAVAFHAQSYLKGIGGSNQP